MASDAHSRMAASAGASRKRTRTPDEARVIERFKRLAPQQKALLLAVLPFSDDDGSFHAGEWAAAFSSQEPQIIVQVKAATGLYEGIVNHLVEMLHAGAKLRGLDIARRDTRPTGPELFDAVAQDGGLTPSQVETLKRLYAVRNELQHASPGVEAREVYDAIRTLLKTLKGFVRSYVGWQERHGITLLR